MNCPRCKSALYLKEEENVSVHACSKCGGTWLNAVQLNRIVHSREAKFSSEQIGKTLKEAHAGIPDAEVGSVLPCPECSASMGARNYNYSSGVMVNVCPEGHGLWLDKDELESVEIFMEHWSDEKTIHQKEWTAQSQAAAAAEQATIDAINDRIESDVSPSGLLHAVLHTLKKLKP